jgi:PAS domain S-box-containing protein
MQINSEQFLELARHFPDPSFLVDPAGNIVAGNPAALALAGLNGHASRAGRLHDLLADSGNGLDKYLLACSHSREALPGVLKFRRGKDYQPVRCQGAVLRHKHGASQALIMLRCVPYESQQSRFATLAQTVEELSHEIAKRKRTERIASAQSESLRVILASIGEAVIAVDCERHITFLNPAAEALTGWSQAEAAGQPLKTVFRIVSGHTRRPICSQVGEALRSKKTISLSEPVVLLTRCGGEHPIDQSAAPIRDEQGQILGAVLVFHDVTQRRRDEQVLRASEERFRLLVSNVKDYAIMMLGLDGQIVSWNEGAERILGYAAEEIVGQNFAQFFTPEDIAAGHPLNELKTATSSGRALDEGWRVRKNGQRFWSSGVNTALRDEEGRLRGFAKIMRDLTEAKTMAEDLRRRTDQLAEADRRKNEFLAMLGHELRNPLAAISNALNVKQICGADPEACTLADEVVSRQIALMGRLMDDLLDVSRITRGKIELRIQPVQLATVVQAAIEAARPQIEAAAHHLVVDLPAEPLELMADPERLEQVLVNLLTNAAKYTDPGGTITIAACRDDRDVVVRVRDTGVGIPPDLLPKIFDLFTQADRSLDRAKGGLGIGLTLVRSLVELHHGSIEVRSPGKGQGSEFTIYLPANLRTPDPNSVAPSTAETHHNPRRVLVVDDNPDIVKMISLIVKRLGHEVWTAPDGDTALELARIHHPEVLLLDIGLPGMNGYELAQRLRTSGFDHALLVAMTGYGQEEDRRRSREAGFDEHLVKPISREKLRQLFEMAESVLAC